MQLKIKEYQIKTLEAQGSHVFIKGRVLIDDRIREIEVFFRDRLEEKKLFDDAEITLSGELVEADGVLSMVDAQVVGVRLLMELPLESLNIKDRLNATGLIHEFKQVFRRDKIRAKEILKVLGVKEEYAEEILLRNSYILPDY